jgi:transcriptional regulator with XRE-family HTH domain
MNEIDQQIKPMVSIDGVKVKAIRERQGLTQLYIANVVGVTTDTISRWENRRYPSIKGENAEKLAEALEVELAEIIDDKTEKEEERQPEESEQVVPSVKPELPSKLKRHLSVIFMVALMVGVLQVARYYSKLSQPAVTVTANRVLPHHVPAGQQFPVIVRVESSEPVSFSLLLKENIPPGCEVVAAVPEFTSADNAGGQIKWVSRLEGDSQIFAYLVKAPIVPENTELVFNGRVLAGTMSGSSPNTGGDNRLKISSFHWADNNLDKRIDDEEILMAYDLFSEIDGFDFNRDLIDEIWASGGYDWNSSSGQYEVAP